MASLKEILWTTLKNLTGEDFKTFKWFLQQDTLQGVPAIAVATLEKADRADVVDRIVENYGPATAQQITLKVLEKINRKDLQLSLSTQMQELAARDADLNNQSQQERVRQERRIKHMIKERQTRIQEIRGSAERSRASADQSKELLSHLLRSLQGSFDNLLETIEGNQKSRQQQAEGSIQELERQIQELSTAGGQRALRPGAPSCAATSIPPPTREAATSCAVKELAQTLSSQMEKGLAKVRLRDLQQFAVEVTLDADSANSHLLLTDDGKQVRCGEEPQKLPDAPSRFQPSLNVLGSQGFSAGRFYYQVTVEGKISWDVGVVKESIARKGPITASPQNGFWNICLRKGGEYKANRLHLSVPQAPLRTVGVFVDYEEGSVSFYDVASADLIHRFDNCAFTEKLYPFFSPGVRHGGENSAPLIISTVCDAEGQETERT